MNTPADVLRWAADRLAELRAAEREWLPATGLHTGEQELRRLADERHEHLGRVDHDQPPAARQDGTQR